MAPKSAYIILNIRKGATEQEIKKSYIELVKKYDPEKHTDRFMEIQNAYERLRDPKKRAKEDVFTFNYLKGDLNLTSEEKSSTNEAEVKSEIEKAETAFKENSGNQGAKDNVIRAYMKRSWVAVTKKLWNDAIEVWNRILKIDPTNIRAKNNLLSAFLMLGYSYSQHELYDEAVELWEKALQINPNNADLMHNLAIACENLGNKEKAEKYWAETLRYWKTALDKDQQNEYLKNCIIEVHKHHGGRAIDKEIKTSTSAVEEFKEILKINPDDFEAQFQIAVALMEEKKWEDSLRELNRISIKHPKNIEVLNLLGWALLNTGQVDNGFSMWRKSLALDPKNFSTKDTLIRGHLMVGKKLRESGLYTPALVHFKALLRYLPDSPEVFFEIGTTYFMKGDNRSAYLEFERVLRLDPKNKLAKKAISELKLRK